ncbi:cytochrome b/b6 domain-containing protein [Shewanella cyperi]|nr:cytochrome b/b6 domain-containing protein [Shewanella cyperi]
MDKNTTAPENKPAEFQVHEYRVWPLPVRVFHWLNFLLVLMMTVLGLLMLFRGELGMNGTDARVGLKTAHVLVGYCFVANLLCRLLYGLFARGYGSLGQLFPGPATMKKLKAYQATLARGESPQYLGHNPKGQLAVGAMVLLMLLIATTGLFRAGTDIYFPPFGSSIQQQLVRDGEDPAAIKPYDNTFVDPAKAEALKPLKSMIGTVHLNGVFCLWLLALLHITAVIYTDCRRQGGLISAMFSGKKWLRDAPADAPNSHSGKGLLTKELSTKELSTKELSGKQQ